MPDQMPNHPDDAVAISNENADEQAAKLGLSLRELSEIAVRNPRNERSAVMAVLDDMDLAPHLAERHYYSIPYKDNRTGKTVFVEGLSIRAAEEIGRKWGNMVADSYIVEEDEERAVIAGVAIDIQTMFFARVQRSVKRTQHGRRGPYRLRDDKWANMKHATGSKVKRNAILSLISLAGKDAIFRKARHLAATGGEPVSEDERMNRARVWLEETISKRDDLVMAQLEELVGKNQGDWTLDDYGHVHGTLKAIAEGEVKFADVFGGGDADADDRVQQAAENQSPAASVEIPE